MRLILTNKKQIKNNVLTFLSDSNKLHQRGDLAHWYVRRFVCSEPGFDYRQPLIFEFRVQSVQWMLQHLNVIRIDNYTVHDKL